MDPPLPGSAPRPPPRTRAPGRVERRAAWGAAAGAVGVDRYRRSTRCCRSRLSERWAQGAVGLDVAGEAKAALAALSLMPILPLLNSVITLALPVSLELAAALRSMSRHVA